MSTPHLIVIMDGGVIHEAISDTPIDLTVLDYDCDGVDSVIIPRTGYGEEAHHTNYSVVQDPKEVEALLSTIEKEEAKEEIMGCPKCGHEWPAEDGPPCPECGY